MNHTTLLNHLISKYDLKSYLEIGVNNPAANFDKINAEIKYGIDPALKFYAHPVKDIFIIDETSDKWFTDRLNYDGEGEVQRFDLVFLDGLHHCDQVQRDFENSLKCLNDGGFIVIHDCLPEREETTHVPRDSKVWHGDVYKWAMNIRAEYDDVNFVTVDTDCGCMILWKDKRRKKVTSLKLVPNWFTYKELGRQAMFVIEPADIDKYLPKVKEPV